MDVKWITEPGEKTLNIKVSDVRMVLIGSNSKLLECRCENCYSSSDEENHSVAKIPHEIEADSHGNQVDLAIEFKGKPGSTMIDSPVMLSMPIIAKRGCPNWSLYVLLIAKLKELQDRGDFEGHERMIQKQLARWPEDADMQASLQIERAVALYMQNDVKGAKKIAKFVLKLQQQLKNPEILTGRALNLLTSIYKQENKFGNAMGCVKMAIRALEHQDSSVDKAELYQNYGDLMASVLTVRRPDPTRSRLTREEAYNSYERAFHFATDPADREKIKVKMAALLLGESRFQNVKFGSCKFLCKDVVKAKKHLDFIEFGAAADNMAVGTKIKLLLNRSDQYLYQGNAAMAMEKAQEAQMQLTKRYDGFERQRVSAEKKIHLLSEILSQKYETSDSEESLSSGDLAGSERSESSESN